MIKNEIAVITSGFLPIPASKGGAVENLIQNIINENEKNKGINLCIFSIEDMEAKNIALKYQNTNFIFFKTSKIIDFFDKCIFYFAKNLLKKKNSQSFRHILQRLKYLNQVSKELKKNNYKKVLLENHPSQYLALKWRKNWKKYDGKIYYHCHNEFPGKFGCDKIINRTYRFITVSEYIKKQLTEFLGNTTSDFFVLRNAVDEDKFKKLNSKKIEKFKEKFNIKNDEIIFLFTGRIVPEKGVLELIKAVNQSNCEKIKLLIVGSSLNKLISKTEYEKLVENEIDKNKIIFTGFINYSDIPYIYKIADVAVVPSLWDDPAPLSIIESIISELPIITTNSGGISEYVNNKNAIILKRNDKIINNLSKSIEEIYSNENLRKSMRNESKILADDITLSNYYNNFILALDEGDLNE